MPSVAERFVDDTRQARRWVRADLVLANARVRIVDEWLETGSQVAAAITLIGRAGGSVAGIACLHAEDDVEPRPTAAR